MNIDKLKNNNPDLKIRELIINNKTIKIIYFESLCTSSDINDFILKYITMFADKHNLFEYINKI